MKALGPGPGAFAHLAGPRVDQGILPVEGVLALSQAQGEAPLAAAGPAGDVGADLVGDVDGDAADRVDQVFEAGEVDDRDVVDRDAEEPFDGLDLQRGAAEGEGGVDLRRFVAGDLGVAVAGDREFAEAAAAGPDQQQRVGPELAFRAAVVGGLAAGLLLEALLRGGGAGLLGVRRPSVGAEDEDRLRAGQQERVAVQGRLRFAGELERLQLGGDGEGEEAERDPAERRQPGPLADPAPRPPAGLGSPARAAAVAAPGGLSGRSRRSRRLGTVGFRSREKIPRRER